MEDKLNEEGTDSINPLVLDGPNTEPIKPREVPPPGRGMTYDKDSLPAFVRINPKEAGMFDDSELSGLRLTQWGSNYGPVPKDKDCSRIANALGRGILVVCNPKGQSKLIDDTPLASVKEIDKVMANNAREIITLAESITSAPVIEAMIEWELNRPDRRKRRGVVVSALRERLASPNVSGLSTIREEQSMIYDKERKQMVDDTITIR